MINNCPLPTAIASIPGFNCPLRFDQLVKLILFRRNGPTFPTADSLKTLSTWTPFLSSTTSTKVVGTPVFSGFTIPVSEALTQGGNDNSTFNGVRDYYGEGFVTTAGSFRNMPSAPKLAMSSLTQESLAGSTGLSNLEAMFVNKDGNIYYNADMSSGTLVIHGFPIYNFRVGSVGSDGFNTANMTPVGFDLPPDWDNYIDFVKPSFNPLTQIVSPATT